MVEYRQQTLHVIAFQLSRLTAEHLRISVTSGMAVSLGEPTLDCHQSSLILSYQLKGIWPELLLRAPEKSTLCIATHPRP